MSNPIATLSADFITRYARDLYHCSSCNYCVDGVWPERGMQGVCATMEQHTRAPGYSGRGYIEAARAIMEEKILTFFSNKFTSETILFRQSPDRFRRGSEMPIK